jgi:hypothetical protein
MKRCAHLAVALAHIRGISSRFAVVLTALGLAVVAPGAGALTITVAPDPGGSPAGGYLALSLFGIAPIAGVGDNTIHDFPVPSFSYAGETWTSIGISSNGYVKVGGAGPGDSTFLNTSLPNAATPNNVLAPFWTDLDPAAGGAVRIGTLTDGSDTWIVVDWAGVRNFSNATTNSFEIWIGIDGDDHPGEDITYVYAAVGSGDSGFLTVGAEDKTGTVGATFYFNGAGTLPTSGTELRVSTSGLPVGTAPEPGSIWLVAAAMILAAGVRARRCSA